MTKILEAINWANQKHSGQFRKGSGQPYISHPIAVSYIIAAFKKSKKLDELIIASICHDTLEDTDATFIEIATLFGPLVASLVLELTNDQEQIENIGKLEYQKAKLLGISNYALLIKLADRYHNISDQPSEKMVKETLELLRHLEANRKLTGSQNELLNAILVLIEGKQT